MTDVAFPDGVLYRIPYVAVINLAAYGVVNCLLRVHRLPLHARALDLDARLAEGDQLLALANLDGDHVPAQEFQRLRLVIGLDEPVGSRSLVAGLHGNYDGGLVDGHGLLLRQGELALSALDDDLLILVEVQRPLQVLRLNDDADQRVALLVEAVAELFHGAGDLRHVRLPGE